MGRPGRLRGLPRPPRVGRAHPHRRNAPPGFGAVVERRREGMLVIGFAAETEDVLAHGRDKLLRKGADAIVLNDVSREGIGFDSDRNAVTFLTRDRAMEMPELPKRELADRILDEILCLRRPRHLMSESDTDLSVAGD